MIISFEINIFTAYSLKYALQSLMTKISILLSNQFHSLLFEMSYTKPGHFVRVYFVQIYFILIYFVQVYFILIYLSLYIFCPIYFVSVYFVMEPFFEVDTSLRWWAHF